MSVSTLLNKNNFKIYVNDITLKNFNLSSDGNYKLVFPPILPPDIGGNPNLSILAVDNIINDVITLKWLQPSENLPFDVINCNILNAQLEINCIGNTQLNYLECVSCNFRKTNGNNEKTSISISNAQIENINYILPISRPNNGQVLSCLNNGEMSWIDKDNSNFIPISYKRFSPDFELYDALPSRDVNFQFNGIIGEHYSCIFNALITKTNPTGNINVRSYIKKIGSVGIDLYSDVISPITNLNSNLTSTSFNLSFWCQITTTGNCIIKTNIETDITAGGTCQVTFLSMFITKCNI
jgi:hypothetical protein